MKGEWDPYPKSVKQIGEPEKNCLVYMEEFVENYIHKIQADGPDGIHAGVLYGRKIMQGELPCYYIFGAAEADSVWENGMLRFGQKIWREVEQVRSIYFPSMEICGWFVKAEEDFMPDQALIKQAQDTYFSETAELFYQAAEEDGIIYRKGKSQLYALRGYFVFFQSNTAMQDYISFLHMEKTPETAKNPVITEEKKQTEQKEEENPSLQKEEGLWRRRLVAAVLFAALMATAILYGNPERAQKLEDFMRLQIFGGEEVYPVSGSVETAE